MPDDQPIDYAAKLVDLAEAYDEEDLDDPSEVYFALREAAALIRRQAGLLARLEWHDRAEGMEDVGENPYWNFCPECSKVKADGHAPDCPLKAALDGR